MAVAYGAEELPPENVAPDSQQEKSPQHEGQEASDVDDNFKDVDDDTADVDVDNSIDAPETPTKRASGIGRPDMTVLGPSIGPMSVVYANPILIPA